jgi:hypothetical protein
METVGLVLLIIGRKPSPSPAITTQIGSIPMHIFNHGSEPLAVSRNKTSWWIEPMKFSHVRHPSVFSWLETVRRVGLSASENGFNI